MLGAHAPTDAAALFAAARCIRELPERRNLVATLGATCVHLKLARRPNAWRHDEAKHIEQAHAAGVPVATILFEGHTDEGPFVGLQDLAPARPLDDVLTEIVAVRGMRDAVGRALAAAVAALHAAGLHHKDLYANHVFVDAAVEPPALTVIDLERMGTHAGPRSRWVVKDLAALWMSLRAHVHPTTALRFLVRYGRAVPGLRARDLRRLAARTLKKADRMARHTPRTPVGDAARPATPDAAGDA